MTAINTDVRRDGGDVTKVESYLRRPRRIRPGELIFLHLPNAQVLLRAILPSNHNSISAPQARRLKGEKPND
jgi:hypothetical protein